MDKFAEELLTDITVILNRPIFTKDEEAVISGLINLKVQKIVEDKVLSHKYEVENLTNFIDIQLDQGSGFHNILF